MIALRTFGTHADSMIRHFRSRNLSPSTGDDLAQFCCVRDISDVNFVFSDGLVYVRLDHQTSPDSLIGRSQYFYCMPEIDWSDFKTQIRSWHYASPLHEVQEIEQEKAYKAYCDLHEVDWLKEGF